jgi:hypothetical protein
MPQINPQRPYVRNLESGEEQQYTPSHMETRSKSGCVTITFHIATCKMADLHTNLQHLHLILE